MSLQTHLAELERRHMALQREIEKEELHPAFDELKLHELKRRKLLLKDEIAKLRQSKERELVH
ncbi:YdcH family protein [Rhodoblastus sp.]|uniref:YdcH family protein n=1 Tax=Rhodoblastus sp. TaxID=1962975 RepID=UPI0035AFB441